MSKQFAFAVFAMVLLFSAQSCFSRELVSGRRRHFEIDRNSEKNLTQTDSTIASTPARRAAFQVIQIIAKAGPHGSISPVGIVRGKSGGDKEFKIAPNQGYHVEDVLVDGKSTGPITSMTFVNLQKSHTIKATFAAGAAATDTVSAQEMFSILAQAGSHGSITPQGEVKVPKNGEVEFLIAAEEGYKIIDVLVDDKSMGPVTSHTFTNVAMPHSIRAVFGE